MCVCTFLHIIESDFQSQVMPMTKNMQEKTCLDDNVERRVCTWECTETAFGAKRTSCWVKRALLSYNKQNYWESSVEATLNWKRLPQKPKTRWLWENVNYMIKYGVMKHTQALLKFLASSLSQQWQTEKKKQSMKFTFTTTTHYCRTKWRSTTRIKLCHNVLSKNMFLYNSLISRSFLIISFLVF